MHSSGPFGGPFFVWGGGGFLQSPENPPPPPPRLRPCYCYTSTYIPLSEVCYAKFKKAVSIISTVMWLLQWEVHTVDCSKLKLVVQKIEGKLSLLVLLYSSQVGFIQQWLVVQTRTTPI